MPKIKIKNSNTNDLITIIKDNNITFSSNTVLEESGKKQTITMNVSNQKIRDALLNILENYQNKLYHDTTFNNDTHLNSLNITFKKYGPTLDP